MREQTRVAAPPAVAELRLHLASDATELWEATERVLERLGLPPPYWAFAWAGGQAVARYVLDHPDLVAGRRVLDFAAGGGLVAIAAARAGAASVLAADLDEFARTAGRMNAALNDVRIDFTVEDLVGTDAGWDVVLAGDVCYERPMTERAMPWLRALARRGATVIVGDPGRSYLPKQGLTLLARFDVAVPRTLEDSNVKSTGVWQVEGSGDTTEHPSR